jgi:hypothetical protein
MTIQDQKATSAMLSRKPCTVILNDGKKIVCDQIYSVSTTISGTTIGMIRALTSDGNVNIKLDDVSDVVY